MKIGEWTVNGIWQAAARRGILKRTVMRGEDRMNYQYIFVDLDNTLLDFEAAEEYSFF